MNTVYRNTRVVNWGCHHDVPALDARFPNLLLAKIAIDLALIPKREPVLCGDCGKDYRWSRETGGLMYKGRFIGPCCVDRWKLMANRYADGKQLFITERCPEGVPFAEWATS